MYNFCNVTWIAVAIAAIRGSSITNPVPEIGLISASNCILTPERAELRPTAAQLTPESGERRSAELKPDKAMTE
jgi:hypothetical protein